MGFRPDILLKCGLRPPADNPVKVQHIGTFHRDYSASGSDLIVTAANIVADAISAGVTVGLSDGTTRALVASDFIASIDVDLKPIGGHGSVGGVQVTSTTADASFKDGGQVTDIDGGGSRSSGLIRASDGFYIQSNFEEVEVKEGSIVTVSVNFADLPG